MANATFTDHNSQICFTLLAFWRCSLGGSSEESGVVHDVLCLHHLHSSLDHRVACDAVCHRGVDQCPGEYRHHLLLKLLLSRLHLLHHLVDRRPVEAEGLVDVADDLESLADHDHQADLLLELSEDVIILTQPAPELVQIGLVKPGTLYKCTKACYGLQHLSYGKKPEARPCRPLSSRLTMRNTV